MTDRDEIFAQNAALRLTNESDVLDVVYGELRQQSFDAIEASAPADTAGRENAYFMLRSIDALKAQIEHMARQAQSRNEDNA